jgi:hypothetical protein
MALLAGTTTVTAGVAVGTGLSKALYDARVSALGIAANPQNQLGLAELAKGCNADASAIISYLVANTVVSTTDTGTVAIGIPVQVAVPAGTGATTAPGTVTATGTGTIS